MSFDKPWMISGGVAHEVEVARLLAHAATSGAEGIAKPNALRPGPLPTPGTKVRINPGAALIANRYPGGDQQTYIARLPSVEDVSVTATGSSGGRSDLVVARILDPQFEGQPPPDVQEFDYARIEIIEGVPAGTKSARDLNLTYPAVGIARLDLPANTGTIQAEHITDVREVAQPRKERHLWVYPLVSGDGVLALTQTAEHGMTWPWRSATGGWFVDVPVWAQRVRVMAQWAGVKLLGSGADAYGFIWVRLGETENPDHLDTQYTSWNIPGNAATVARENWMSGDDKFVPNALRGQSIEVYLRGRVNHADSGASKPRLDMYSAVSLDIEFYENRS